MGEPRGLIIDRLRQGDLPMSLHIDRRSEPQDPPHLLASLGARCFPVNPRTKHPLITDYYARSTRNHAKLDRWLARWPKVAWAIVTGADSGIVALDIDRKKNAHGKIIVWGMENLHRAGIVFLPPATPTQITRSGGFHLLSRHPGVSVPTGPLKIAGKNVAGVEIKSGGPNGHCIVAGPGYLWQPCYPIKLALATCPPWMIMPDERRHRAPFEAAKPVGELSAYCEKALRNARKQILEAPPGQRHNILLRAVFNVAGLVEGYGMPASLALQELEYAALEQPRRNPRPGDKQLLKTVGDAFAAGLRAPREPRR
jgi:putative DNA primase/helicase